MRNFCVVRNRSNPNWKSRIPSALTGRTRYGQDGFFEAALDSAFDVTHRPASAVLPKLTSLTQEFAAFVVNYKQGGDGAWRASLLRRLGAASLPSILFMGSAEARNFPSDDVLDRGERERIAAPGREMFLRDYGPNRRGMKIRQTIQECST